MSQRFGLVAAFAAIYIIWGSTYLAIRFAIETIPPFLMVGSRFLIAGAIMYAWTRWQGTPAPTRAQWRASSIAGALMLLGGTGIVVWAEKTVPSGLAALLVATVPLWVVLLEWLRPGGTRPTLFVFLGLLLGLVGLSQLIGPEELVSTGQVGPIGATALVLASLSWAAGTLYTRHAEMPPSPLMATAAEMLAGGVLILLIATGLGEWGQLEISAISLRSALAFGYLMSFGSLIAFTAYVWLLTVTSPARVATYAYVNPVVAVFLGWALGGETITSQTIVAAAIIVAGVALITSQKAKVPATPPLPMAEVELGLAPPQQKSTV